MPKGVAFTHKLEHVTDGMPGYAERNCTATMPNEALLAEKTYSFLGWLIQHLY